MNPPYKGWKTTEMKELCKALLTLKTSEECAAFLRGICTFSELKFFSERWQVAQLVARSIPYRKIYEMTGVNTGTITRGVHWFHHGEGGYRNALEKMKK